MNKESMVQIKTCWENLTNYYQFHQLLIKNICKILTIWNTWNIYGTQVTLSNTLGFFSWAKRQHPSLFVIILFLMRMCPEPQRSSVTGLHGRLQTDWKINIHTLMYNVWPGKPCGSLRRRWEEYCANDGWKTCSDYRHHKRRFNFKKIYSIAN